ncbi:hypothetical protein FN846DRAFT_966550 [Sphaerosporella brunnea]|uniref:Chitin-binding type-4 domain-containing protein n=1 Tax=Sphaerosporella brunnea TaxID=1250544 RepID=A0A5J5EMX8_9PEZI|nr:hypothetical protein FN846DRAFT_966550 [Sphaerosporella brunnea]
MPAAAAAAAAIRWRLLTAIVFLMTFAIASAHMAMADPPALRYKTNPYKTTQDYDYTSPLSSSGSNYPCKGYQVDMGTSAGKSVATYSPGGTYTLKLDGSATHNGGSCQISLSFDKGKSWQVIKSFVGGCVKPDPGANQQFSFTIPKGTPSGDVLFAWTWFNNEGNREMYMNCAVVTISGGRRRDLVWPEELNSFQKRALGPNIFLANIGNGCTTVAGTDVEFPDPGSNIERGGSGKTAAPAGNCGKVVVSTGGGSGGSGGGKDCAYWRSQGYLCSEATGLTRWRRGLTLLATLIVGMLAMVL